MHSGKIDIRHLFCYGELWLMLPFMFCVLFLPQNIIHPPFAIPLMSPKHKGFTAVVLTYDRDAMLFRVLAQVAKAPSLAKVMSLNSQKSN